MPFLPRACRYLATSTAMFLLDLLIVFILTQFFQFYYVVSVVVGFSTTTALLFLLNQAWAFQKEVHFARAAYAAFVAIMTLGIVTLITYIGVQFFGLFYLIARVIAAAFGFAWSYTADSLLTFEIPPFG